MEPPAPQPLSVRLRRQFCAMAAEMRVSQEKFDVFVGAKRESPDRKPQLRHKESIKESVPDAQRRRI